jgi:catechol 2,3-dioxygenase-like lactoylglutathione lyase family enzyme
MNNPLIQWFSLGGNQPLHLIQTEGEVIHNKTVHIALRLSHFEAFTDYLHGKKIPFSNGPGAPNTVSARVDGVRQIYLQDPDGYWIEINNATYK